MYNSKWLCPKYFVFFKNSIFRKKWALHEEFRADFLKKQRFYFNLVKLGSTGRNIKRKNTKDKSFREQNWKFRVPMGFNPPWSIRMLSPLSHWRLYGKQGSNVGLWLELHHAATESNNDGIAHNCIARSHWSISEMRWAKCENAKQLNEKMLESNPSLRWDLSPRRKDSHETEITHAAEVLHPAMIHVAEICCLWLNSAAYNF